MRKSILAAILNYAAPLLCSLGFGYAFLNNLEAMATALESE